MAEVEVIAFMDFAGMEVFLENVMGELVRRHQREIASKGEKQDSIDCRGLQKPKLFWKRRQQLEDVIGAQDPCGVRFERDGHGPGTSGAGSADDVSDDSLVRTVNAIEIADCDDGRTEVVRDVGEFVEDLHELGSYCRDAGCRWSFVDGR